MRIFNNHYMKPLSLTLILLVLIPTSWTTELKKTENLLRDILQNTRHDSALKNPIAAAASHKNPARSIKQVDERLSDVIAQNVLHFGKSLAMELVNRDPQLTRSEIFSPLSIMAALSLLTLGAKGKSYQQLKELIGIDSDTEFIQNPSKYHEELGLMLSDLQYTDVNIDNGLSKKRNNANWRNTVLKMAPVRSTNSKKARIEHIIKVANGLFVQEGYTLNPDYSQVLKSIYETEFKTLDFQTRNREARDYVNDWVNKATYGKIPQIINSDIDKSTNVILASALYFKASWETSFFDRATKEDYFYPDGVENPPIKVQMMSTGGVFPFYNAKEYDCRIIGLPYKGNETTMYVIQPNNSSRQRLFELMHNLNAHKINNMIDNMDRKTTVMVFPKMHFTRSMTLKTILKDWGYGDIFRNGYSDLSLIGGRPQESYAAVAEAAPLPLPLPPPPAAPAFIATPAPIFAPRPTVSFDSIYRKIPNYQQQQQPLVLDRFDETPLIFRSRFGEQEETNNTIPLKETLETLPTTESPSEQNRPKRQVPLYNQDPTLAALANLEANRLKLDSYRSDLFVDDIIHKVDFAVDEQGTEAAAATLTYLHRSGTDVVFRGDTPFLIIIRHDPTKLPLFFGIISIPEL